jgi:hypothetical protein
MTGMFNKLEFAVPATTLGARVGARAALGPGARRPTLREVAQIVLAILCLATAAVLFFGWLMIANPPPAPGVRCTTLGRGGASCAGTAQPSPVAAEDCPIPGKGARLCGGARK